MLYQLYQADILDIRKQHNLELYTILELAIKARYLVYKKPTVRKDVWFNKKGRLMWKKIIISVLVCCFWGSIIGIYNEIYIQKAVSQGLRVLNVVQPFAWCAFGLFILLEAVYFHLQILAAIKSMGSTVRWAFGGCKFDSTLETRFDTPSYKDSEDT